jgi:hypothetical protein
MKRRLESSLLSFPNKKIKYTVEKDKRKQCIVNEDIVLLVVQFLRLQNYLTLRLVSKHMFVLMHSSFLYWYEILGHPAEWYGIIHIKNGDVFGWIRSAVLFSIYHNDTTQARSLKYIYYAYMEKRKTKCLMSLEDWINLHFEFINASLPLLPHELLREIHVCKEYNEGSKIHPLPHDFDNEYGTQLMNLVSAYIVTDANCQENDSIDLLYSKCKHTVHVHGQILDINNPHVHMQGNTTVPNDHVMNKEVSKYFYRHFCINEESNMPSRKQLREFQQDLIKVWNELILLDSSEPDYNNTWKSRFNQVFEKYPFVTPLSCHPHCLHEVINVSSNSHHKYYTCTTRSIMDAFEISNYFDTKHIFAEYDRDKKQFVLTK